MNIKLCSVSLKLLQPLSLLNVEEVKALSLDSFNGFTTTFKAVFFFFQFNKALPVRSHSYTALVFATLMHCHTFKYLFSAIFPQIFPVASSSSHLLVLGVSLSFLVLFVKNFIIKHSDWQKNIQYENRLRMCYQNQNISARQKRSNSKFIKTERNMYLVCSMNNLQMKKSLQKKKNTLKNVQHQLEPCGLISHLWNCYGLMDCVINGHRHLFISFVLFMLYS